jgi:DNA-binding winged helix-turn-helix (wHTH) protein
LNKLCLQLRQTAKATNAEATGTAEGENLTTTMSEIDRLISDVVVEKEVIATISDKGKKIDETSSEGANFDLRHLGGQQLSEEDKSELKEFAISCGYQQGSTKKSLDASAIMTVRKL